MNIKDNAGIKRIPEKKSFRGFIKPSKNRLSEKKDHEYYIINELLSDDNTKVFSAIGFTKTGSDRKMDENRYSIRYLSKEWIKKEFLGTFNYTDDQITKFFLGIERGFITYQALYKELESPEIKKKYNGLNVCNLIQRLYDYIDNDDGLFIVLEFCDWTLSDYIQILKEPTKNTLFPFEVKLRKFIPQLVEVITILHETNSICFGGLLNSNDICVSETASNLMLSQIEVNIKFPNPFLANLMTMLKIYKFDTFPSFYPPEVYRIYKGENKRFINMESFDISNLASKISPDFDVWALGYLIYEIIDNPPFIFTNLDDAIKTLTDSYAIQVRPNFINPKTLLLINSCLQYDPQKRLENEALKEALVELKKEYEDIEDFENKMRQRIIKSTYSKDDMKSMKINEINALKLYAENI